MREPGRGVRPRGQPVRTPAWAYWLISRRLLRCLLGGDLPARDVRWVPRAPEGGPGGVVVEVGAGGGFYTGALRRRCGTGARLVVLDPFAGGVSRLRVRHGVSGVCADGQRLPLRDGSVDVLFYGYALEEFADLDAAVAEAARVLRPGGHLVLFLWRPLLPRQRRSGLFARLNRDFLLLRAADGPQNLRRSYRRRGLAEGSR